MQVKLLKLFLKYGLPIIGVVALLAAVWTMGAKHGYGQGYTTAWNLQQKSVDALTDQINAKRNSDNARLNDAEQKAPAIVDKAAAQVKANVQYRDRIIREYYAKNPDAETCARWAPNTVNLINQVLDGTATGDAK